MLNRRVYVIAESALNDTRLIRPPELGGYGLDAQWNDDFHHSLHTLLTKEREGYYADFGDFQHMAQAFSEGFVYSGHYSVNIAAGGMATRRAAFLPRNSSCSRRTTIKSAIACWATGSASLSRWKPTSSHRQPSALALCPFAVHGR